MTLAEWLEAQEAETWVYLGSKSAFLWIDPAAEMIKRLDWLDWINYADLERGVETARRELSGRRTHLNRMRQFGEGECAIAGQAELVEKAEEAFEAAQERLANHRRLAPREVLDVYDREAVEPLGKIVIIEGDELGRYYMFSETEDARGASFAKIGGRNESK